MDFADNFSEPACAWFAESFPDGIYVIDRQGNFTYSNSSLCKMLGYSREEVKGLNFFKLMDGESSRKAHNAFSKLAATGEGFSDLVLEVMARNGDKRILGVSAAVLVNEGGEKEGFQCIARDVTERVRSFEAIKESQYHYQCQFEISREAERQYKTLLDFIPYPMVASTLDGRVMYINPAFTNTFGWKLDEIKDGKIPYVPPGLEEETSQAIKKLLEARTLVNYETKRVTKDGRILDVLMRGEVYLDREGREEGQLLILRDITQEKRMARTNETLLRISMALPAYPVLEDLLDYITGEIRSLLGTEGAFVILLDEEKKEFFFKGAAYDDISTQTQAKEVRFPADKGISGRVLRTGEPALVRDVSKDPDFYPVVDEQLQFHTHDILSVPLKTKERSIGVLMALNKKQGTFDQTDVELLSMVGGTVALSIENAKVSKELKTAYEEVSSLNRAKDKVINHLSHELKTPLAVLSASLNIFEKTLSAQPKQTWKPTMERSRRNLERLLEIQYEVEDIIRGKDYRTYELLSSVLDQASDELEALIAEETGETGGIKKIRKRMQEIFGPRDAVPEKIVLNEFVRDRLEILAPLFFHRELKIKTRLDPSPSICIPPEVLQKVIDGLVRNAVENTPDEGEIELQVRKRGEGSELVIRDYGVGITEANQKRVFEGFFTTQETMAYSSKRPFDFNAGGKGADLLRMKIFSERYNFKINFSSKRCPCLPRENDVCPGRISQCELCRKSPGCHRMGGTTFTLFFPPSPASGCRPDTFQHKSNSAVQ